LANESINLDTNVEQVCSFDRKEAADEAVEDEADETEAVVARP
jgi:hypothetical protein